MARSVFSSKKNINLLEKGQIHYSEGLHKAAKYGLFTFSAYFQERFEIISNVFLPPVLVCHNACSPHMPPAPLSILLPFPFTLNHRCSFIFFPLIRYHTLTRRWCLLLFQLLITGLLGLGMCAHMCANKVLLLIRANNMNRTIHRYI